MARDKSWTDIVFLSDDAREVVLVINKQSKTPWDCLSALDDFNLIVGFLNRWKRAWVPREKNPLAHGLCSLAQRPATNELYFVDQNYLMQILAGDALELNNDPLLINLFSYSFYIFLILFIF